MQRTILNMPILCTLCRDVFAGVFVNGRGGGKTHALRFAPFDALDLMAAKPDLFAGYPMLDDLLAVTRRTEQHRLAFMFDFLIISTLQP